MVGTKMTYTDISVYHILSAFAAQRPEEWNNNNDIPKLKAFKERIASRPRIAAFEKSDRCPKWAGDSYG